MERIASPEVWDTHDQSRNAIESSGMPSADSDAHPSRLVLYSASERAVLDVGYDARSAATARHSLVQIRIFSLLQFAGEARSCEKAKIPFR